MDVAHLQWLIGNFLGFLGTLFFVYSKISLRIHDVDKRLAVVEEKHKEWKGDFDKMDKKLDFLSDMLLELRVQLNLPHKGI